MSKISPTNIGIPLFISRTRRLYTVIVVIVLWTILTTVLTIVAVNSKYFHNTYECESTYVQPIKTLTTIPDQEQSKLITRISTLYGIPKHKAYEIVNVVDIYTKHHNFPDTRTVLAVIATESRFKQHATSAVGAKGYMQITRSSGKNSTYEIWGNLKSGVELLREYREHLGSDSAAIMAYNIGLTSYKRGGAAREYLNRVNQSLEQLSGA